MHITGGREPTDRRVHITDPRVWNMSVGTDYWANFSDPLLVPAGANDLVNYGWLENGTWVTVANTGADLLTSSDVGTVGGIHVDTADDAVTTPFIFGDYSHAVACNAILGYTPTKLNFECYARFSASNDEELSGFGWVENGATAAYAKTDWMALIAIDASKFSLESGAAAAQGDTAKDTVAHVFKVICEAGATIEFYVDGTKQTNELALQTDLWPCAWVINAGTGGSNDPVCNWLHIWYE